MSVCREWMSACHPLLCGRHNMLKLRCERASWWELSPTISQLEPGIVARANCHHLGSRSVRASKLCCTGKHAENTLKIHCARCGCGMKGCEPSLASVGQSVTLTEVCSTSQSHEVWWNWKSLMPNAANHDLVISVYMLYLVSIAVIRRCVSNQQHHELRMVLLRFQMSPRRPLKEMWMEALLTISLQKFTSVVPRWSGKP